MGMALPMIRQSPLATAVRSTLMLIHIFRPLVQLRTSKFEVSRADDLTLSRFASTLCIVKRGIRQENCVTLSDCCRVVMLQQVNYCSIIDHTSIQKKVVLGVKWKWQISLYLTYMYSAYSQ